MQQSLQGFVSLDSFQSYLTRPTISACLIVKNEEGQIDRALRSLAEVVDEIVLVDTGSTDGTVQKALQHGVRLFHFEWREDFAAARNYAMDQASGDWILLMDADEELTPSDRAALLAAAGDLSVDAYFFSIDNVEEGTGRVATSTRAIHMVRNRPHFRYLGKVHEQILPVLLAHGAVIKQAPVRMKHFGYQKSAMETKRKDRRNLRLLEQESLMHSRDPYLLFNLGQEHMAAGDITRAADYFSRSLEHMNDPNQDWVPVLIYYLSGCLLQLRRYEEAEKALSRGQHLHPLYTELVYREGQVQKAKGSLSRALAVYLRCLAMGESPPRFALRIVGVGSYLAWHEAGLVYREMGLLPESVNAFRSALSQEGSFLPPLRVLLDLLLSHETPDRVGDFVLELRQDWSAEAYCLMAAAFSDVGAHGIAIEILDTGQTRTGERAALTYQKGWVRAGTGDFHGAIRDWAGLPRDSSFNLKSRFAAGILHLFLGEVSKAREEFAELSASHRFTPCGELGRLWADACEGRVEAPWHEGPGLETSSQAEGVKDLFYELMQMGIRHRQDRFVAAGLAVMGRVEPDQGKALAGLSKVYYRCGLHDRAVETARAALQAGHPDPDLWNILGNVAHDRGLLHDAVAFYRESVAIHPKNPEVFLALASVLDEMGQVDRAEEILAWALDHSLPGCEVLQARRRLIRTGFVGSTCGGAS